MFAEELGLSECGLDILVTECYSLLGLISYLTAGEKETRAWTIEKGTKAPQAAGKIHSDFERGFIRAEIVDYKISSFAMITGDFLNAFANLKQGKAKSAKAVSFAVTTREILLKVLLTRLCHWAKTLATALKATEKQFALTTLA